MIATNSDSHKNLMNLKLSDVLELFSLNVCKANKFSFVGKGRSYFLSGGESTLGNLNSIYVLSQDVPVYLKCCVE